MPYAWREWRGAFLLPYGLHPLRMRPIHQPLFISLSEKETWRVIGRRTKLTVTRGALLAHDVCVSTAAFICQLIDDQNHHADELRPEHPRRARQGNSEFEWHRGDRAGRRPIEPDHWSNSEKARAKRGRGRREDTVERTSEFTQNREMHECTLRRAQRGRARKETKKAGAIDRDESAVGRGQSRSAPSLEGTRSAATRASAPGCVRASWK